MTSAFSMPIPLILLTILSVSFHSALAGAPSDDPAGVEFFEKSVRPILTQHCFECHSSKEANGKLDLETREGTRKGGETGPAILPGEPEKSLLVSAIRYKNPDLQMPPQNPLESADQRVLEKWIAIGAPDPREGAAPRTEVVRGMSLEEGRRFWSFMPIANPPMPMVERKEWASTPIDLFLLSRMEEKGVVPAPPAEARMLIRRATFDLIGLPPTPDEVQAFLNDSAPDSFSRVLDRLLASPGYGERWGRHWLDVARYADSNGLDENLAFGNAWRYRDYVIDSFNRDKPIDRFMVEQVAGDLLPDADQETKTATGFLVLGAKVLAEPDREKLLMDTIDEQIDTLGKAFLGMTLGCVRCHDHKFDPVTQQDYYGLAAILKGTKTFGDTNTGAIKHWHEYSWANEEEKQSLAEVEKHLGEKRNSAANFKAQAMEKLRNDAKSKAAEYLVAATRFDPQDPLTEIESIAAAAGLHPRILHHTRLHLEYHRDDPLFVFWWENRSNEPGVIRNHYEKLFAEAESAWAEARKADPKLAALADPRLESARTALHDAAGFLAVPPKPEFAFDAETLAEYHRLADEARIAESEAPDESASMGVCEGAVQPSVPIHIRGSHRNLGEPVSRQIPAVMVSTSQPSSFPSDQSGRRELAQWIVSPDNPLTSRVFVNRAWRWHFGRGIVPSTDNFGVQGDRPSHSELLDWLAGEFQRSSWSLKNLHRVLMESSAYQCSNDADRDLDSENQWRSRFQTRRLEAEEIRDAILFVAGRLDQRLGGKSIPLRNRQFVFDHTSIDHTKYDSTRRAVYLPIVRNNVYPFFEQFDFPDPTMPTGSRHSTVIAPQALLLMNSELVIDSARAMANNLLREKPNNLDRVRHAYEVCLSRPPTPREERRAIEFIQTVPDDPERAWTLFCQALLSSNDFIYVR